MFAFCLVIELYELRLIINHSSSIDSVFETYPLYTVAIVFVIIVVVIQAIWAFFIELWVICFFVRYLEALAFRVARYSIYVL